CSCRCACEHPRPPVPGPLGRPRDVRVRRRQARPRPPDPRAEGLRPRPLEARADTVGLSRLSPPTDDLYARLSVSPQATSGEIEGAWRELMKLHHPDVAGPLSTELAQR